MAAIADERTFQGGGVTGLNRLGAVIPEWVVIGFHGPVVETRGVHAE